MTEANSLYNPKKTRLIFALTFTVSLMMVLQASASKMFCRSDPIVYFSDGTRLQFNTEVQTSIDDVIGIRYELHVPVGAVVDRIVYTPSWARSKETVVVIADQSAGNYQVLTLAQTGTSKISVTVNAMMVSRPNHGQGSTHRTTTGISGQTITINF